MSVKPKYYSWSLTPLKYYHFLRIVSVLWALLSLSRIINYYTDHNPVGIVEQTVFFALQVGIAIGLNRRSWTGVLCLYANYAVMLVDYILTIIIYVYTDSFVSETASKIIGGILATLIYAIPTWIYFQKRKPLFQGTGEIENADKPEVKAASSPKENSTVPTQTIESATSKRHPPIKYCHKCGFKLLDDSKFCSNCGASMEWE